MKKRVISVLLIALLVLSLIPSTAFAEQEGTEIQGQEPGEPQVTEAVEPADTPAPADGPESAEPPAPADGPESSDEPEPADGPESSDEPEPADEPESSDEPEPADEPESAEPPAPAEPQQPDALPMMSMALVADLEEMSAHAADSGPAVTVKTYDIDGTDISGTETGGTYSCEKLILGYYLLTVSEYPGYEFIGWAGDKTSSSKIITVTKNDTVTAKFKKMCKLTLTTEGNGRLLLPSTATYYSVGSKVNLMLALPTPNDISHYHFAGWRDNDNPSAPLLEPGLMVNITMTGNRSFAAVFKGNMYDFSVESDGNGTVDTSQNGKKEYGTTIDLNELLGDPNPGYKFKEWQELTGQPWDYKWKPTSSSIATIGVLNKYKAIFELEEYTVSYKADDATGGTVPTDPNVYHYNDEVTVLSGEPEKTGYTFTGWKLDGSGEPYHAGDKFSMPARDVELIADWTAISYTVVFHANDGSGSKYSITVDYDQEFELENKFTRTGYTFFGWATSENGPKVYDDGATVENLAENNGDEINLYALWEPITYYVHYDANSSDAEGTMADSTHVYDTLSKLTPNGFTREGHTFDGWATTPEGPAVYDDEAEVVNLTDVDGATVTLYAKWNINTYSVRFFDHTGTVQISETQTVSWGSAAAPVTPPVRTGYTFTGWTLTGDDDTVETSLTNVRENIDAVADYEPITYYVRYDSNGGEGTMADSTHVYDAFSTLTPNGFTREGHTFAGWATTPDGPVVYENGASVSNLASENDAIVTLYAQWNINTYSVRFFDYTGTVQIGETQIISWGGAATPVTPPARTGFTFTGWTLTGDDDTVETSLTNVRENIDAVATYALNRFTVTFVNYDGSVLGRVRVPYGGAATAPEVPEREGYTFTGWDTPFDNVTDDITVTALYRINTYTVTFVNYDGTVLSTQTVEWNTAATAPEVPEREGYTFIGWDADFSAVTEDMTVTAQFAPIETVENEPVPGTGDDSVATLEDEPVPQQGPAAFPWWWIVIGVGAALLLFLLIFFLVKRRKGEQTA